MLEVKANRENYRLFLLLTGIAFEKSIYDKKRSHSFYWAMRWLARQIIGETWLLWNSQIGGE